MEASECLKEQKAILKKAEAPPFPAHDADMGALDFSIQARCKSHFECNFIVRHLHSRKIRSVLDVVAFMRFHSSLLQAENFEVTTLDGSDEALNKAFNAGRGKPSPAKRLPRQRTSVKRYDAILCLGNSFTQLFSESEYPKYVAEFHALLNPNGMLIVDQVFDSKETCPLRPLLFWAGFQDVQTFGDFQEGARPKPSIYVHIAEKLKRESR